MLSNAYFLAKFRFDTAENEPAKNLQNFARFANFADPNPLTACAASLEARSPVKPPLDLVDVFVVLASELRQGIVDAAGHHLRPVRARVAGCA